MKELNTLREHYCQVQLTYPDHEIVGVYLYGSQNYGLSHEDSDIDSLAIVCPSWNDIIYCRQPISTTLEAACGNGQIKVRDVRYVMRDMCTPHLANIEWMFTDYAITNPMFASHIDRIYDLRNDIAFANEKVGVNSMIAMATNIHRDLIHKVKQGELVAARRLLARLYYIDHYLDKYYQKGLSFSECIYCSDRDFRKEYFTLRDEASDSAEILAKAETAMAAIHRHEAGPFSEVNEAVYSKLNSIQRSIIKFVLGDNGYGKA